MNDSDPSRGRRALLLTAVLPAAALVFLALAGAGFFLRMASFPTIFGAVLSLIAIATLWVRRDVAPRPRSLLVAAAVLLAVAAPFAQWLYQSTQARSEERAALAALSARPAPALDHAHVVGGETPPAFASELTVVNFWATWCPPCVEEMPELEEFYREHRGAGVELIGFTRFYGEGDDAELASIASFAEERGVSFPILVAEDGTVHDTYRVPALPTTVLIGRGGEVLAYGVGRAGTIRVLDAARRRLAAAGS